MYIFEWSLFGDGYNNPYDSNGPTVENAKELENSKRSTNKLKPNEEATGNHSTFKKDENGDIFKYETYKKTKTGHNDPVKRFDGGRYNGDPGAPHTNKQNPPIPTPYVQGKKVPVRPPKKSETPRNKRFKNGSNK